MERADWFSEIVSGKELDAVSKERKKAYLYKREPAETRSRYESEGWEYDKDMARNHIKLKKLKSDNVRFENRVWLMLYNLGFTNMNGPSDFAIEYEQNNKKTSKQIDVLAIDDEVALLVECKSTETLGKKQNFKKEIDEIAGYRRGVFSALDKCYPEHKKICIFATNNYVLAKTNAEQLEAKGIRYFDEEIISYYEGLGKILGKAARFQLLGSLLAGDTIKGMDSEVAAVRSKMGGKTYYSFTIEPSKLLKMAYVLHRNSAQPKDALPAYQRLIKRARLNEIKKFVDGKDGIFPNSIIVDIDNTKPQFEPAPVRNQPKTSSSRIGILKLPKEYRSIFIIDGQHRLYGYAESERADKDVVPVVAFYGLKHEEQIELFMQINETQKKVPATLRTTLNADLLWHASDMSDRQKALRSKIAQDLAEHKESPLYDRIVVGENASNSKRSITLTTIDQAIEEAGYLGTYKDNKYQGGGLFEFNDIDESYSKIYNYLIGCFEYIKSSAPDEWEKTTKEGAVFTINNGIYGLIGIFADILKHLQDVDGVAIKSKNIEELCGEGQIYLLALVRYVEDLDIEKREEIIKNRGNQGRIDCLFRFRQIIHEAHSEFYPEKLEIWIQNHNKQHNEDAEKKIDYIESKLTNDFKVILSEEYGEDWLRLGVDEQVFKSLNERVATLQFNSGKKLNPWDLANLEDCRKVSIYSKNWKNLFKPYFEKLFPDSKVHEKNKLTNWITELQTVKKNLQASRYYSVSLEDYKLICDYYDRCRSLG